MIKALEKLWIRLGIYMTMFVFVIICVFTLSIEIRERLQFYDFLNRFPEEQRADIAHSVLTHDIHSVGYREYMTEYAVDGATGLRGSTELYPLFIGLVIILFCGIALAWALARMFIRPIAAIAEAAGMIAEGDLTVRAQVITGNTEVANMIAHFNQMAASLENLERDRKATAAAISHELRTPLTILNGRLHALCDGVIEPSAREYQKLLDQTQHLVRLVEDVHLLGLDNAHKLPLYCAELDLAELVRVVVSQYTVRAAERDLTIVVDTKPTRVFADGDRMSQIFSNLLENAIRYASQGKKIEVAVWPEHDYGVLEVRDHGQGLPQGMLERIFDPFFRLDQSRSRATGGSGLGLSVVRTLVEQHEGRVEAYNHTEGGAVFRVTLPLLFK